MPLWCKRQSKRVAKRGFGNRLRFLLAGSLTILLPINVGVPSLEASVAIAQSQPDPPTIPAIDCPPVQTVATTGITHLMGNLAQTATWADQPAIGIGSLIEQVGPQLLAYLNASPFPEVNPQARQAKVPVMMYHDILPEKEVFFDVTPEEFEAHLKLIQEKGLTPISMDQLVTHLRTGLPLPEKPILLTFDDGYLGHYTYVYPLLKKYNYPALFSIYTDKIDKRLGRPGVTWEHVREMATDPLVTIASHSVTHRLMPDLSPADVQMELQRSKQILESALGIPIRYFTYPEGKYNAKVAEAVQAAGYTAALTMNDAEDRLAGQSESLMAVDRVGQSRIEQMVDIAWGGPKLQAWSLGFDFASPVQKTETAIDDTPFIFISGGKPITIHADSRYQVPEILAKSGTGAIAAVDGGFFSLEFLDSNEMLGPVLSQVHGRFFPGRKGEIPLINNRPLVLISENTVRFVPFDSLKHNTLEGIQTELPNVTDAFVGAGFLVENGQPQPPERFGKLFDFNEPRHRAFWGINQQGQPVVGVSVEPIGSVDLGKALAKAGFRDAVMLDSGASTSLAYQGHSLVGYVPRPVPHVVALVPPAVQLSASCALVSSR